MWLSSGAAASTAKQSGARTLCRLRVCCPLETGDYGTSGLAVLRGGLLCRLYGVGLLR